MCDTFGIPSDYSESGVTLFAKNSDRSPNEPHLVVRVPKKNHCADSVVSCTYISIPQVEYTRETILCKPSWIWGAEMGVNEDRVAIGNEAVFTKAGRGKPALTGMDMLRLALERAGSAKAAAETIITLLEKYGQGGNCGFDHPFYYDNSFLIADPNEIFILETSGKNYAIERAKGKCAISNRLTIEKDNFSRRFTEPVFSHFSGAAERRRQVMEALSPDIDAAGLFKILRSHEPKIDGKEFTRGSVKSVCMHGGGLIGDHTTGSITAVLRRDKPVTLWCTGASTPCISAFKPVFWDAASPGPVFPDSAPQSPGAPGMKYWLQREHLHRAVVAGLVDTASLRDRIKALEEQWLSRERRLMDMAAVDTTALKALSDEAGVQEQAFVNEFSALQWRSIKSRGRYERYWRKKNEALG